MKIYRPVGLPPDQDCLLQALFLYPMEAFLVSSVLLMRMVKRAH
jgi:hypothetical protein